MTQALSHGERVGPEDPGEGFGPFRKGHRPLRSMIKDGIPLTRLLPQAPSRHGRGFHTRAAAPGRMGITFRPSEISSPAKHLFRLAFPPTAVVSSKKLIPTG